MIGIKKVEEIERWESVTATMQARQTAIFLDPFAFIQAVRQGAVTSAVKCTKGIPASARFKYSRWVGLLHDKLVLVFEDESFLMVKVGMAIPFLELEFEDI